jgi:hypothetical protein
MTQKIFTIRLLLINGAQPECCEIRTDPKATNARPGRSWPVFPFYDLAATIDLGAN